MISNLKRLFPMPTTYFSQFNKIKDVFLFLIAMRLEKTANAKK